MSYSRRAAIYEVEYQEIRDVPFVQSLLGRAVNRVIEVPCGAGRLSRHIAPLVSALDLVDLEPNMVARAVEAAHAANPDCVVTGHAQDMRRIALDHPAELVILPREGLQLLPPEDGKIVLTAVAKCLAPGGLIFLDLACLRHGDDIPDPDYYRHGQPDGMAHLHWTRPVPGGGDLRRISTQQDEGSAIHFDFRYEQTSEPAQNWSSQMRIYRYDLDWVKASAPPGTRLEHIYGGYDRSPHGPTSRRLLALYRKEFGQAQGPFT